MLRLRSREVTIIPQERSERDSVAGTPAAEAAIRNLDAA
jgi:hypothetical protein